MSDILRLNQEPQADPQAEAQAQQPAGEFDSLAQGAGASREGNLNRNWYTVPVADWEYDIINRAMQASDKPEDTAYTWASALTMSRNLGKPLDEVLQNFDSYHEFWLGSRPSVPRTSFTAITDSFGAGMLQFRKMILGAEWMATGGTNSELERQVKELSAEVAKIDSLPKPWIDEAVKYGAAPKGLFQRVADTVGSGLLGAVDLTAENLPQMILPVAGAVAAAAVAPEGIAGVALALGASRLGQFVPNFSLISGDEYTRMRQNGVRHEIAAPIAAISGAGQALIDTFLGTTPGMANALTGIKTAGLGYEIAKRLLVSGKLGAIGAKLEALSRSSLARAGGEYLKEGIGEGTGEFLQQGLSAAADATSAALQGQGVATQTADEVARDMWESFKGGLTISLLLGVPGTIHEFGSNVKAAKDLTTLATKTSHDEFMQAGAASPVVEMMSPARRDAVLEQVYANAQRRPAPAPVAEAPTPDVKLAKSASGEVDPAAAYRDQDTGRAYTEVVPLEQKGDVTTAVMKAGNPTSGELYTTIAHDVHPDHVEITDVGIDRPAPEDTAAQTEDAAPVEEEPIPASMKELVKEHVRELAAHYPGLDIRWNPADKVGQEIRDELVANNPRGQEYGLQWYDGKGTNVTEIHDEQALRDRLNADREKIGLKEAGQVDAAVWIQRSLAKSLGLTTGEFLKGAYKEGVYRKGFAGLSESDRALAAQGARGATTYEQTLGNVTKALLHYGARADISTHIHEPVHAYLNFLTENRGRSATADKMLADMEAAFGVENGDWDARSSTWNADYAKAVEARGFDLSHKEALAYAVEDYFRSRALPEDKAKAGIVQKIAAWIVDVYKNLKRARVEISPQMEELLSGIFNDETHPVHETLRQDEAEAKARSEEKRTNFSMADESSIPNSNDIAEAKRQADAIPVIRGADGKPLAPNGKPSNLNERQWKQVRTENFKKLFGDWEALGKKKHLSDSSPVKASFPLALGELKAAKEAARAEYAKLINATTERGYGAITKDGRNIKFSRSGWEELESHTGDRRTLMIEANLAPLLESSTYLYSASDEKRQQAKTFHYFAVKADFGELGPAYVMLTVRENNNGEYFYNGDANSIEKIEAIDLTPLATQANPGAGGEATASKSRLARWWTSVKPETVTKVLDENGEPLVVYHGSPDARFLQGDEAQFKTEKERFGMGRDTGAYWFTPSKATALSYADEHRAFDYQNAEAGIAAVYLSMQNPLVIEANGKEWREAQRAGKTSDVIQQARDGGHDGVIIRNVRDDYNNSAKTKATDTYVVFDSAQIKSVNNRGTWSKTDPRINFQEDIEALVDEALTSRTESRELDLGIVSDAERIFRSTGIDAAGLRRTISSNEVRHIFNEHGDPSREEKRGQRAVTKTDVSRILEVVENPDRLSRGNKPNSIKYEKRIGDDLVTEEWTAVEHVRGEGKGRKLSLITLWIRPVAGPDAETPGRTSETGSGRPSSTISPDEGTVNFQPALEAARGFNSWEEFRDYTEATWSWDDSEHAPEALSAEDKDSWYRRVWEEAHAQDDSVAEAADPIGTFVEGLRKPGGLEAFLLDMGLVEQYAKGWEHTGPQDAEEYAQMERNAELRDRIRHEVHPLIQNTAAGIARSGRAQVRLSTRAAILSIMEHGAADYAALAAEIRDDAGLRSSAAEAQKAREKRYGKLRDPRAARWADLPIADRARLEDAATNEETRRKIRSGEITSDEIQALVSSLDAELKTAEAEKATLEKEIAAQDLTLTTNERSYERLYHQKKAQEKEIIRLNREIARAQDRNAALSTRIDEGRAEARSADGRLLLHKRWLKSAIDDKHRVEGRLSTTEAELARERTAAKDAQASADDRLLMHKRWLANAIADKQRVEGELAETKRKLATARTTAVTDRREAVAAAIEKTKLHIAEVEGRRRAARELRDAKFKASDRIMHRYSHETINWDQLKAIRAIQSMIDPRFRRPESWMIEWKGRSWTKEEFQKFAESDPTALAALGRKWHDRLTKKGLDELTLTELEELAAKVESLADEGRQIKKARDDLNRYEAATIRNAAIGTLEASGNYEDPGVYDSKEWKDAIKKRTGLAVGKYDQMDDRHFALVLDNMKDSGEFTNILVTQTRECRRAEAEHIEERTAPVVEYMEAHKISIARLAQEYVSIDPHNSKIGTGQPVKLSKEQLLFARLALRDEDSRKAFIGGNFFNPDFRDRIAREEEEVGILPDATRRMLEHFASRIEAELKDAIDRNLTDAEKGLADLIGTDFNSAFPRLQEAFVRDFNHEMVQVQNYIPIRRQGATFDSLESEVLAEFKTSQGMVTNPEKGHTMERQKIGWTHQAPIKTDLFGIYFDAVKKQEHLAAYAAHIKQLNQAFKSRQAENFKYHLVLTHGQEAFDRINKMISEMANPAVFKTYSGLDKTIRFLRGSLGAGYLGFRPGTALKQLLTSWEPFIPYTGGYLAGSAVTAVGQGPWNFVRDAEAKSTILRNRQATDYQAILRAKDAEGVKKALAAVGDKGMKLIEWADRYCTAVGWDAAYRKAKAGGMDEAAAIRKADDVVLLTSPSGHEQDMAPFFRDGGEAMKILTQFMSPLSRIYQNWRYDVPAAFTNGRAGEGVAIIASYMLTGAILYAALGSHDDDPEKEAKRWALSAFSQMTDSVPLIGSYVSELSRVAITGKGGGMVSSDPLPAISRAFQGADKIAKGALAQSWDQIGAGIETTAEGAGLMAGLPVSAYKDVKKAISGDPGALIGIRKEGN